MSLLLRNISWLVTQNPKRAVFRNISVQVEHGIITQIGTNPREDADHIVDCEGKIVLPGLINTHTHLAMTMFRGYADDMRLEEWLQSKIWPLERNLTPEIVHYGALLGCLEMISTGTTTFLDMYFHMEEVAKAVSAAGLRAYLSHAVFGGEGSELEEKSRESTERFVRFLKELKNPQVNLAIGPHAIYSCSPELLVWSKDVAQREKTVLHIHLAETRSEQARVQKEHGIRETKYLEKLGFLCPNLLAAHCVWLTKSEVSTLAKRGVKVSHCPVSNMKLASGGVAPIPEMLESGVVVSIGTDGAASNNSLDMFESMKVCALAQAHYRWDPAILAPQKVLDFATIEAAKALGIESKVGSVEVGKEADLIVIDTMTPNLVPLDGGSLISDLVYSAKGYNVETTIVHGELLMRNRVIQSLNESEIYEKTQENALNLIKHG